MAAVEDLNRVGAIVMQWSRYSSSSSMALHSSVAKTITVVQNYELSFILKMLQIFVLKSDIACLIRCSMFANSVIAGVHFFCEMKDLITYLQLKRIPYAIKLHNLISTRRCP